MSPKLKKHSRILHAQAEGTKYDQGKLRYDLLPPEPIEEVVKVYTGGAAKYAPWNWAKGIKYSRVYAAQQRHIQAFWMGKVINEDDFGLHHLAHALWCVITLLYYEMHYKFYQKFDDRPHVRMVEGWKDTK